MSSRRSRSRSASCSRSTDRTVVCQGPLHWGLLGIIPSLAILRVLVPLLSQMHFALPVSYM